MWILPLLLFVTACGSGGPADEATAFAPWRLERDLRIGSVGDPTSSFTWFRELEVAPDGRIYTMHEQEHLIRIHAPDGRFVRAFGGEGEGPGEFRNLGTIGLLGDTLWVLDYGNYRFSYFDLDGELLESVRVPIEMGRTLQERPPRPRGLFRDGTVWAEPPAWSLLIATGEITQNPVLRMSASGVVLDTITTYPLRNAVLMISEDPRQYASFSDQPFVDTEIVQVSPNAVEVVRIDRTAAAADAMANFRVVKLTFEGDTVFVREYPYEPVRLEAALVDSIIRSIGQRFEGRSSSAPTPAKAEELAREALYTPTFHPPVTELVIGRDGTLWLRREDPGTGSVEWNILSPSGEPWGTLIAPTGFRILAADRTAVWGSESDELDVPYIVRYRVREQAT